MAKTTGPMWVKLGSDLDQASTGLAVVRGNWRQLSGLDSKLRPGWRAPWQSGYSCRENNLDAVGVKQELGGESRGALAQNALTLTADEPGFQSPCAADAPHLPSLSET